MLKLIIGSGKSGKTSTIMDSICRGAGKGKKKQILIVPEQYSHEAERYLCAYCGDSISLYGEVLSFSRLCGRIFSKVGEVGKTLDAGGKMLVMELAVKAVEGKLKIYGNISRHPEFLSELLDMSDELKTCRIDYSRLWTASENTEGSISDKLHDLSLILGSYDAVASNTALDPSDRLSLARDALEDSGMAEDSEIYIDGFVDFSAQEMAIVEEFIRLGTNVTAAFTCEGLEDDEDIFKFSSDTAARLKSIAEEFDIETEVIYKNADRDSTASVFYHIEKGIRDFGYTAPKGMNTGAVQVVSLPDPSAECEYIAGEILELIHSGEYRYRDIAVMTRGFEEYEGLIESIFDHYGIPVYLGRKADIMQKPILMLISSVLDILTEDWSYESVFKYLKTGLSGISDRDCDILENYVITWNIRGGSMWKPAKIWNYGTEGFKGRSNDERLEYINGLKTKVSEPLIGLSRELKNCPNASDKVQALYSFMEEIGLSQRLEEKADIFREMGMDETAEEYAQLWNILISAMEQCVGVLGDMPMDFKEFAAFFKLLLSKYEVGTIPVSIDNVTAGDMNRIRKRNIKYLFIIGASDERLPMVGSESGMLTESERNLLNSIGIKLPGSSSESISRELNMIYQTFILPDEGIIVTFPRRGADGSEKQPSYIVQRLKEIFDIEIQRINTGLEKWRIKAKQPCLGIAAASEQNYRDEYTLAAREYFRQSGEYNDELTAIEKAVILNRGKLSKTSIKKLYGDKIRMSASRVDKYYSCRYSYFLQYGLKAKPRIRAEFDASIFGVFVHYILEHVTAEINKYGGFSDTESEKIRKLTDKYVERFIAEELGGMSDKSGRFIYLFNRLRDSVNMIVDDMAQEFRNSDFIPLDFELEFSEKGSVPAPQISGDGVEMEINGFVDRVDGWVHDGKLYLRVADYKTGRKAFDLSDVWYGMGLQMLIYLFTLEKYGKDRYGMDIVPAGVMYTPARDVMIQGERHTTSEEVEKEISKRLLRSGLFLENANVLEAMEHGEKKKYIPVKVSEGAVSGSVASLEQLGKLRKHVENVLLEIGLEMKKGNINADPYYKQSIDTACRYCDYYEICHFDRSRGDKPRYLKHLKPNEAWEKIENEA